MIDVLAPEVRIEVPMAAEFVDEEAALITLTFQQSDLLASFGRARRMVVTGCAGSGKTMLAVEQAKRSAAKGADVAFVCFNKALRDHLKRTEGDSGIAFHTFHGLCTHLAHRAKLDVPRYPDGEIPQSYWSEELPDLLLEATEELGGQFDAIYVDEAQDLHNDWLDSLETTLRDPAKDQFWLFMDDNQRVYEQRLDVPDDFVPYDLTTNCRNTQAIHREVVKKYEGEVTPRSIGPEGRELEFYAVADQPECVASVVRRLIEEDEVLPQDIVVLSSHGKAKSSTHARGLDGRLGYVDKYTPTGPCVRFSSIRAFKGLEAPVVVMCELEDTDEASRDQQIYVAMSRAQNHCVVVVPGPGR
ncbi:AAA family ATPase [Thermoleophilia bacterium SCSIO 60948]|nr:AAA family ATPase [Thermoleophilia bacterium SCSIO 60948]